MSTRAQLYAGPGEPWYEFRAQSAEDPTVAELHIFGVIGDSWWDPDAPSAKKIADQLAELSDDVKTIRVLINSPGGNVHDGTAIFNALRRQREKYDRAVEVEIEGMALSAATLVACAGSPKIKGAPGAIRMPSNTTYMIHNPWFITWGDARQLRKDADLLDKVTSAIVSTYRWVTDLAGDTIRSLMDADTWMEAAEALENGFITEVVEPVAAQARFDPSVFEDKFEIPAEHRDRVMAFLRPTKNQPAGPSSSAPKSEDDPMTTDPKAQNSPDTPTEPQDQRPQNKQGSNDPQPAPAATVVRMCREANCVALAEGLLEAGASLEDVQAAVDRGKQIVQACHAAEMPELAEGFLASDISIETVRAQLASVAARMDDRNPIDGKVAPNGTAKTTKNRGLSAAEIYAERNKAHFATTGRQEQ